MASPTYRICVKCGFKVPLGDLSLPPHFCPKPASVKVYTEEEKREFERRRKEEASRPKKAKAQPKLGTNFSMLAKRVKTFGGS